MIDMADEYMAGKMIYNKIVIRNRNRRKKESSIEVPVFNSEDLLDQDMFNDSISDMSAPVIRPPKLDRTNLIDDIRRLR